MDPFKNQTVKPESVKNAASTLLNNAPTIKKELSAYQQNLSSPIETPSFQPTTRAAMGQMMTVMEQDPVRGKKLQADFSVLQNTKGSMYYNPYTKPTNQAVTNLADLGIDVSNIDDNWYTNNAYLQSYYNPSSTTNNPTSPGKNATPEQTAGYNYYQVYQAKGNTDKALAESAALRQELSYWANRKDLNYSDDEIIGMIDWKKYPTLVNMKETAAKGAPMELNSAVDMATDDWMYGVIWSARNDGGTGSVWKDMAMSANGQGNLWQSNDEIAAKLDKSNKTTYSPNSVGMTMNQEGLYFSRDSFDQGWVDDNMYRLNSNDETEVKYFTNVMKGEERTQSAESELDALNKKVDSWIARGVPAERALKMLENELGNGSYPTLNSMDEGRKYGNPVNLTRAVDYRKEDVQNRIRSECASNSGKKDTTSITAGSLFDMVYPSNFFESDEERSDKNKLPDIVKPSQQKWQRQPGSQIRIMKPVLSQIDEDVARMQDENVRGIGALLYDDMTPAEAAGVASWSTNSGTAIDSLTGLRNEIIQQRKNGDNSALEALTKNGGKRVANSYITGSLFNYKTINDYQNTQQQLAADLAKEQDLISQLGDLQYMDVEINGKKGTYAQKTDYEFSLNDGIDGEATDYQINLGKTPDGQFYVEWVGEWNGEYYQEVNDQSRVQSVVDSDQAKKAIADADINREKADAARSNMYSGETEESDDWNVVTVDGDKYQIELSDETESGIGSISVWNEGMGAYQTIDGDWAAEIASSQEAQDFLKNHNLRAQNFTLANPLSASAESTYENVQDKVIELRQLQMQIEDEEDYLKTNAPDYEASLKEYDNAGLKMQIQGRILTNLGADTSDLVVAQIVMENMIPYTKYEPTVWDTLSTNNVYSTALRDIDAGVKTDMTRDELFAGAAESKVNIEKQIANLEYMKKYIEGNGVFDQYGIDLAAYGINVGYSPNKTGESIIGNIDRKIASLQRDLVDVDAFLLQQDKDFKSKAEAGRMLEFDTALQNGYVYGNDGYHTGGADEYFRMLDDGSIEYFYDEAADTEGTELEAYSPSSLIFRAGGMDMYNLLTEEEKDTYYYYLSQDERKAIDYINSLTDQTYGVLTTRRSEKLREDWANFTSEHFLLGNAAAIIMSPMASVMGGSYFAYSFITGKEFNPNASWMAVNNMRSTVREQSAEEIEKTFGEGSTAAKIAKFCYDVVVMRADSAMNAITFGNLIGDLFPSGEYTGTFGKMINEFASASPMGVSAMADAIAEAKTNGASDSQAYAIGGFTFLAETVTEAISLDNMREAFVLGEDFTVEGAKEFMINWLTKAGVSEALGESFNDYVEKAVDEYYMGENSQHSRRVDEYRLLGYGKDEAEYLARQDEFGEIMYTALVSYLSPGLDVFSAGAGRYSAYRSIQNEMNRGGGNYTLEDARNGVIEQEVNARRAEDLARLEAEDRWNNTGIAPINYGAATEVAGELGFVEQKEKAQEKIDEAAAAVDFEILTDAQNGNWSAHDAGVAAVLDEGGTQTSREMAQAAAANLHEVLGEERLAAEELEEVMYGAVAQGISTSTIKQAFMVAALGGDQSAVRQLMQSAAYQTATPDVKAAAIEQAFKKDVNAGLQQAVQQAVRDNRVAAVEAELISKGLGKAVQEAEDKVTDAMQAQQKAEEMLATQREVEAAKAGEAEEATKNLIENPGDTNAVHRVQSTQQELRKASEVTHEYEMALAKQQEAVANATENAKRVKQETMAEIRQQAEAVVAQEDQVRAEEAAQQAEQERVAAEEQAKVKAAEAEQNAKEAAQEERTYAEREDMIRQRLQKAGYAGENLERQVQRTIAAFNQGMRKKVNMNSRLSEGDGNRFLRDLNRMTGVTYEMRDLGDAYQNRGFIIDRNHIVLNSNMTKGQVLVEAALHEATHAIEGTEAYQSYANFVIDAKYGENGGEESKEFKDDIERKIQENKALWDEQGIPQEEQYELAKKEIVADYARMNLAKKEFVNQIVSYGLGGKLRAGINKAISMMKGYTKKGAERAEYQKLQTAAKLLNNAMKERAQHIHDSNDGHTGLVQGSITGWTDATGLTLEVTDDDSHVYKLLKDGKEIEPGKYTADMVNGTPVGNLIDMSGKAGVEALTGKLERGKITQDQYEKELDRIAKTAQQQREYVAKIINMIGEYQDAAMVWELAGSLAFSALKTNGDPQYSDSYDFGTICTKTQAILNAISETQVKLGRALTKEEIDGVVYEEVGKGVQDENGKWIHGATPCPPCYVYATWVNKPARLEMIRQFQNEMGSWTDDQINEFMNQPEPVGKTKSETTQLQKEQNSKKMWIELCLADKTKDSETGETKWVRKENPSICPNEILLDLRRSGEMATQYAGTWAFMQKGGNAQGKAIAPYSDARLGESIVAKAIGAGEAGARMLTDARNEGNADYVPQFLNPFLSAETSDRAKAEEYFKKAVNKIKAQNLKGGQRWQSWSDFRAEWGSDYLMEMITMQALGSQVQTYTKVVEALDLLASAGFEVNMSLMPYGDGFWHNEDGSIMVDEDGNMKLRFSPVTGINPESAEFYARKYGSNGNVQPMVVGISDEHIKAALAGDYITFVIPFHGSGGSVKRLQHLMSLLHEQMSTGNDYTKAQSDKFITGAENTNPNWALRESILTGKFENGLTDEEYDAIYANPYLKKLYEDRYLNEDSDAYHVFFSNNEAQQIYPYEYWDTNSTLATADVNSNRFIEYCDFLGVIPRFSGLTKKDGTEYANFSGRSVDENGNVTYNPVKGYWKLLIDRSMYNRVYDENGKIQPEKCTYHKPQAVSTANINIGAMPMAANNTVGHSNDETREITERIVQRLQMTSAQNVAAGSAVDLQQNKEALDQALYDGETVQASSMGDLSDTEMDQVLNNLEYMKPFSEQIDDYADVEKRKNLFGKKRLLVVGGTPQVLNDIGIPSLPVTIKQEYVKMAIGEKEYAGNPQYVPTHRYDLEDFKKLPEKIAHPVAVIRDGDSNAIKIYIELKTQSGETGLVPLIFNQNANINNIDMDVNHLKSVHGSLEQEIKELRSAIENDSDDDIRLFYLDAEKYKKITAPYEEETVGHKSESDLPTGTIHNVTDPGSKVNLKIHSQTDTRQFNAWFGKGKNRSKVVNEDGSPRIVYHGTTEEFDAFDMSKSRINMDIQGAFFSPYEIEAGGYGENVGAFYLNIKNPASEQMAYKALRMFQGQNGAGQKARDYLISQGYDGVFTGVGEDVEEYIAFYPEQIKSATENIGTFDPNNPNYRYSTLGDLSDSEIASILNELGLVNEEDNPNARYRQFGKQTAQNNPVLAPEVNNYLDKYSEYTPETNREQMARAYQWIAGQATESDPEGYHHAVAAVTSSNFNYASADGQAQTLAALGMAVQRNDVIAQARIADAYNSEGTDIARALQARKIFKMMTPEGRIATMEGLAERINEEIGKRTGTKGDVKISNETLNEVAHADTDEKRANARKKVINEIAEQMPANWKDRIRSLRMLAMLANPRTHIRNVVGNMLFIPAVGMKNKIAALMELGVKQGNKTKTLAPVLSAEARQFAREDAKTMKDTLTGEAKYNEESAIQRAQKPFSGLIQALIDFNSNMLEKEDWIFLKGHYRRALGGWMMANGYTAEQLRSNPSLLEQGRAYAIQEAQKATYRDFNNFAASLNKMSQNGGLSGFLVDAILPFKKTPANILRRGIEYSPVSIIRTVTTDLYHLKQWNDAKNGKLDTVPAKAISPAQFFDRLGAGLSGSAVMLLGALLSRAGIISVGFDDDDEFEKARGGQEYSLRFNIGGQDFTFTMDWAAPMSMPFFVGAAVNEQLQNQEGFDFQSLVNAFGNITEPVFNLSMLDGVNTILKTSSWDNTDTITQILAKVGTNYVTSYWPSVFGATTRTFFDDTRRKSFVKSGEGTGVLGTARYAWEQTENKIPGLSQTNIPVRDIWGNPETSSFAERLLENFVLPGYVSERNDDPVINEMERVFQITGDKSLIPSDPPKSFTYKNKPYVLSAEEWDTYKMVRGQTAHDVLNALIQTDDYKNAKPKDQANMIDDAWSYADKVGKAAIVPDYEEVPNMNGSPATRIAKDTKITSYKGEMIKALNAGDWDTYETMVEGLRTEGVEDSEIKTKIGNEYRDRYKKAYKNNDETTMTEIEEILDMTGFDFDIYGKRGWIAQVEKEIEEEDEGTVSPDTTGRYGRGNIDLNNRQVVHNADGSISTEQSFSVNIDGKEVLLPTVINGKIVSEDEAIDHYYETGEYLGKFDTVEEAEAYAEQLHKRQDWYYHR